MDDVFYEHVAVYYMTTRAIVSSDRVQCGLYHVKSVLRIAIRGVLLGKPTNCSQHNFDNVTFKLYDNADAVV